MTGAKADCRGAGNSSRERLCEAAGADRAGRRGRAAAGGGQDSETGGSCVRLGVRRSEEGSFGPSSYFGPWWVATVKAQNI